MMNDLRFGVRMLAKNPAFTAVAVLSLALGIGANTAIFQLLNAVRLKTLPLRNPQELAQVKLRDHDIELTRGNKGMTRYGSLTNPLWEQIRDRQQAFSGITAWGMAQFNLAHGGEIRWARGLWVSGDFFNVLGVNPERGRLFDRADDQRGCTSPGVVISHGFWQTEFGGANDVIGRNITLSDRQLQVIGVTPKNFFGLEVGKSFDVALPICADAIFAGANQRLDSGTNWWLVLTGRLKPGWTVQQASEHVASMSSSLFQQTLPSDYPQASVNDYLNSRLEVVERSSGISLLRANYERPLWLLLAIAGLVLLIACANLANLLLARASAREREIAVRLAVGASRFRIIRQLLVETVLLAAIGTLLGAGLAQLLSRFLVASMGTTNNLVSLDVTPDLRVLGFAAGVAALTCLVFGLAPAIRATRVGPGAAMKAAGRGLTAGRERFSLRRALVVVQVAISLVLVASALLFTRSLNNLLKLDAGFNQENLLITRVGYKRLNVDPENRLAFRGQLLERIKAIPGVQDATEFDTLPLTGGARGNAVWLEGKTSAEKVDASFNRVGVDYFRTLGIPLLAGRPFGTAESRNSQNVAIINQTLARMLNVQNPVGKRFVVEATPGDGEMTYEVVGLVPDAKFEDLREVELPVVYLSSLQDVYPATSRTFLIRSSLPASSLTASVKRSLTEVNPGLDIGFQPFRSMVEDSLLRERLLAKLSGAFGVLALLLASIGLYGLLSYGVASRTNEIGIRMALGAGTGNVMSLIVREALLLAIVGVGVGVPIVLYVSRFAESLLFNAPTNFVSLAVSAAVLIAVALLAAFVPARRATKVDPLVALRSE